MPRDDDIVAGRGVLVTHLGKSTPISDVYEEYEAAVIFKTSHTPEPP